MKIQDETTAESSQKDLMTGGVIPLWGSLEWKVQLYTTNDLSYFKIIFISSSGVTEEHEAKTLEELADILRNFSNKHDLTIFDRRIARFLFEYLLRCGVSVEEEHILSQIKKKEKKIEIIDRTQTPEQDTEYIWGKKTSLWGSLRWSIQIGIQRNKNLYAKMKLILYDHRTNTSTMESFSNVLELSNRLKTIALNLGVTAYDRRIAIWVLDYFQRNFHIDLEFSQVIKAIRSKVIEQPFVKLLEESPIGDYLNELLKEIDEDVLPRLKSFKINLDEVTSIDDVLNDFLKRYQEVPQSTVTTKQSFVENGKEKSLELALNAVNTEKLAEMKLETVIKSQKEKTIENLHIENIIPYDLKIEKISSNYETFQYEKKLLEDGLHIVGFLNKLEAGKDFKLEYKFKRRINRTLVIFQRDGTVHIINTNFDAKTSQKESFPVVYYATPIFSNITNDVIQTLIVSDFITYDFTIKNAEPSVRPTNFETIKEIDHEQLKWHFNAVEKGETISWDYVLQEIEHIILEKVVIPFEYGNVRVTRLIHPLITATSKTNGKTHIIITIFLEYEPQSLLTEAEFITLHFPISSDLQLLALEKSKSMYEAETETIIRIAPNDFSNTVTLFEHQNAIIIEASIYPYERRVFSFLMEYPPDLQPMALISKDFKISLHEFLDIKFEPIFKGRHYKLIPLPPEHLRNMRSVFAYGTDESR